MSTTIAGETSAQQALGNRAEDAGYSGDGLIWGEVQLKKLLVRASQKQQLFLWGPPGPPQGPMSLQGSSEDELPAPVELSVQAPKCPARLRGNSLASLSEVQDHILVVNPAHKTLKENVQGRGLMSSGAQVEGKAFFVPFRCCFGEGASVNLGVSYKWGSPMVPRAFIQLLNRGGSSWDECFTPVGSLASFRGSVDLLKLTAHELLCV